LRHRALGSRILDTTLRSVVSSNCEYRGRRATGTCGMAAARVAVRIDLPGGCQIGLRKLALLEAIHAQGSISGAARAIGMTYRNTGGGWKESTGPCMNRWSQLKPGGARAEVQSSRRSELRLLIFTERWRHLRSWPQMQNSALSRHWRSMERRATEPSRNSKLCSCLDCSFVAGISVCSEVSAVAAMSHIPATIGCPHQAILTRPHR
jgi:hypothetical protein